MKIDADVRGVTWPESEVRAHLELILASTAMARSESLSSFLRFVVEETLAGSGGRLKARVIAIHAFPRTPVMGRFRCFPNFGPPGTQQNRPTRGNHPDHGAIPGIETFPGVVCRHPWAHQATEVAPG